MLGPRVPPDPAVTLALAPTDEHLEPRVEAAAFVLALRTRGIADLPLLRAMERVPREVFAPRRYADLSRQDVALPLPCGETMTAPGTVAAMLAALAVRPGQRALEVGTGSGYVTALLCALGARVHTVERRPVLAESAAYRLAASGFGEGASLAVGDGLLGDRSAERVERIVLNGVVEAEDAVTAVASRLAAGGRLVCGRRDQAGIVRLHVVERDEAGNLHARDGAPLRLSRLG